MEVFLNRTYMKRTTYLLLAAALFSLMSFSSCERDKYLDWKYLNQSWYNEQKSLKEDNSDKNYWTETESGLLYRIVPGGEGIGDKHPSDKSWVNYQCTGVLFNGKVFQETANLESTINVKDSKYNIITGLQEGIKMMKKNAVYEFIVPYEIGYGEDGNGTIPPYTTLKFKIILSDFGTY